MTSQTYCENASSAIIYISLTGGREGKIISENPPVTVYSNCNLAVRKLVAGRRDSTEDLRREYVLFEGAFFSAENNQPTQYSHFAYSVVSGEPRFNAPPIPRDRFYAFIDRHDANNSFIWRKTIDLGDFFSLNFSGEPYYLFDFIWLNSGGTGFLIEDADGTLYSKLNTPGLTINYSVQCVNCPPGKCAGGDGSGGVVCMDCEGMQRDVKNAIRSYKK